MPILGKKGYFYGCLGNAYGDKQIMKCEEKISHHSILETFVHISTTMWQLCLTSEILTFLWFFTAPPGWAVGGEGDYGTSSLYGEGGIRSSKYQLLQFKWKDFLGLTMFFRQKKQTIPLKKKVKNMRFISFNSQGYPAYFFIFKSFHKNLIQAMKYF